MRLVGHVVTFYSGPGELSLRLSSPSEVKQDLVQSGFFFYLPPERDYHVFEVRGGGVAKCVTIFLPSNQLRASVSPASDVWPAAHLAINDTRLAACLRQFVSGLHAAPDADHLDAVAQAFLAQLARLLNATVPPIAGSSSSLPPWLLRQTIEQIDGRLAKPPSLVEMSRASGLSPGHFARKLRRTLGMGLVRLIHHRRTQAALTILATGSMPISDIGHALGYSSQSHFTKVFRSLIGISPARLRRLMVPGGHAS